jgi:hypothetical protein
MNCLVTISGIIVAFLQRKTLAKIVRNPELSVLLLDTKQIVNRGTPGSCNAVTLSKEDSGLRLRLRFQDDHESSHQHPYIEVQDSLYQRVSWDHSLETLLGPEAQGHAHAKGRRVGTTVRETT